MYLAIQSTFCGTTNKLNFEAFIFVLLEVPTMLVSYMIDLKTLIFVEVMFFKKKIKTLQ